MSAILVIGLVIFLGTLSGKIVQRFKIPQVTGYIMVGLLLGQPFLKIISPAHIELLTPVVNLALGILGFMLGAELKFETFKNRGRSIYSILLSQGFFTFGIVTFLVTLFTGELYLGVLLGAIATATDPAATSDVLWENKARGPLTTSLLAIVALDDVLALLIYAFAGLFAKSLIAQEHFSLQHLGHVFLEIGMGFVIGVIGGFILYRLIHFVKDRERILPFSFGAIAITVGLSSFFKIDLILASMLAGATLTNIAPVESKEIFETIRKFSSPIFIFFFVIVGARLDPAMVIGSGITLVLIVYFFGRIFGKAFGSFLGGIIGKAPQSVTRYLGFGLFSQAGVAIGMAMSINNNLSQLSPQGAEIGATIINIAVAGTFIFLLISPPIVRWAVMKAAEAGKNVTEEDIIAAYQVSDLIEKNVPVIKEDTPLYTMVETVKTSESDDFCVVDESNTLLGTIHVADLRDILFEQELELNRLVLAKDIAIPVTRVIAAVQPLKDAVDILRRRDLDFLPVVKNVETKELEGIIHYRHAMIEINKELLRRRGQQET